MKVIPVIPLLKFDDTGLSFKIFRISNLQEEQKKNYDVAQSHDNFEITWITHGTGKLFVDLREYSLFKNSLYFVKPNQVHRLLLSREARGFTLAFKESFVNLGVREIDLAFRASMFQLFLIRRSYVFKRKWWQT